MMFLNISETGTISRIKGGGDTLPQEILKSIHLGFILVCLSVSGTAATPNSMSHLCFSTAVFFIYFLLPPPFFVISQLCVFGACCIAIFMHGFTAKGSVIHFSRPRPLLWVSVSAYSIYAALWLPCHPAPGFNCIEVIYMQDEYCICILTCPNLKAALQLSSFWWPEFLLH